jgi:hypothetical protein
MSTINIREAELEDWIYSSNLSKESLLQSALMTLPKEGKSIITTYAKWLSNTVLVAKIVLKL